MRARRTRTTSTTAAICAATLLAAILLIVGCAGTPPAEEGTVATRPAAEAEGEIAAGAADEPQGPATPSLEMTEPGPGPYDLALRLEQGATYTMNSTIDQTVTESMMGMMIEITQHIVSEYDFDVLEARDDESLHLRLTYRIIDVDLSAGGSDDVRAALQASMADANESLKTIFDALTGIHFDLEVARDGSVIRFTGADDYRTLLMQSAAQVSDASLAAVDEMLSGLLSDETLMNAWSLSLGHVPPYPVSVGDSWTREMTLAQGMAMTIENVYTLTEVTRDSYTVAIDGVVRASDDQTGTDVNYPGFSVTIDLDGTQSGQVTAARQTGWIVSQTTLLDATGQMTLEQDDPPNVKIDGTFSTTTTTTTTAD